MPKQKYVYVIIESNGHSAVAHKPGDWQGESVQLRGRMPDGSKAYVTASDLCNRFNAPVIDLRGCDTETLAQDFPICIDVFLGYKSYKGMHLDAYLRWFVQRNVKVWYPKVQTEESTQAQPTAA